MVALAAVVDMLTGHQYTKPAKQLGSSTAQVTKNCDIFQGSTQYVTGESSHDVRRWDHLPVKTSHSAKTQYSTDEATSQQCSYRQMRFTTLCRVQCREETATVENSRLTGSTLRQ